MSTEIDTTRIDDRDTWGYSPVCTYCKHWRADGTRTCAAFPEEDSIPWEIWTGENTHEQPHEGDNGIRFELREGAKMVGR